MPSHATPMSRLSQVNKELKKAMSYNGYRSLTLNHAAPKYRYHCDFSEDDYTKGVESDFIQIFNPILDSYTHSPDDILTSLSFSFFFIKRDSNGNAIENIDPKDSIIVVRLMTYNFGRDPYSYSDNKKINKNIVYDIKFSFDDFKKFQKQLLDNIRTIPSPNYQTTAYFLSDFLKDLSVDCSDADIDTRINQYKDQYINTKKTIKSIESEIDATEKVKKKTLKSYKTTVTKMRNKHDYFEKLDDIEHLKSRIREIEKEVNAIDKACYNTIIKSGGKTIESYKKDLGSITETPVFQEGLNSTLPYHGELYHDHNYKKLVDTFIDDITYPLDLFVKERVKEADKQEKQANSLNNMIKMLKKKS